MKKRTFWGLTVGISLIIVIAIILPIAWEYSWGEKGDLKLILTTENPKPSMGLQGHINVTYSLKNVGNTKLRVLEPLCFTCVHVLNLNNTSVRYKGPVPSISGTPVTNNDLFVLEPGKSKDYHWVISARNWAVEQNKTYSLVAGYYSTDIQDSMITLPYWKGELHSDQIAFTVVP